MKNDPTTQVDLAKTFNSVTRTLKENQEALNAADDYNHNHGDNMVRNFQVITNAVREKKSSSPTEQLDYASQKLSMASQSGSAQLYAQGLSQAASRLQGQKAVTPESALALVQALLGGQQANPPQENLQPDAMSSLLNAFTGGQETYAQTQPTQGDALGSLVGSLLSGGGAVQSGSTGSQSGLDMNMLLSAGKAFIQARQQGAEPLPALAQALMAGSQMNSTPSHSQSGQLVAGTLLNTIGSLLGGSNR